MPTTYDLGQLAELLGKQFSNIQELYLFGSRRFRTKSGRSDVDILIIHDAYIQPKELRHFAVMHCRALDFFLVHDGRATSCQNESYIESSDLAALLSELRAVKFWERSQGRLQAKIDWTFTIDDNVGFTFTSLPDAVVSDVKNAADMSMKELLSGLKPAQFWGTLVAIATIIGVSFCAGYWLGSHLPQTGDSTSSEQKLLVPQASPSPTVPKPTN